MARPLKTVVAQSRTDQDVDTGLLARIVAQAHRGTAGRSTLARLFGMSLRLSPEDRQPADASVLRRFDDGPEPEPVDVRASTR